MFGSQQPGFGAASQPAFGGGSPFGGGGGGGFGAKSAVASSPFGAPSGGFGAPAASPFGQQSSTPAFGGGSAFGSAASTPGFGASAPGFGAAPASPFGSTQTTSAFGGGGFGAAASPTGGFGASSPAGGFGASSPAGGFGSSAGAFGTGGQGYSGFGASPSSFSGAQAVGTTSVKYQDTVEQDTTGGSLTSLKYHSISAMPAYRNKTFEELRAEDYQAGVKGNTGAPAAGASGQSPFGAPSTSSPFGAPAGGTGFGGSGFGGASGGFGAQSSPGFGASPSPGFGGATTAFGATSSAPAGSAGGFGASKPAFGAGPTSGFGSSTPAFGAGGQTSFGAPSTPGFGGAPPTGFEATSSASGFGASSTPSFGGGTPGFGSSSGGLFGQSSAPAFGGASAPSFGASSGPAFGASGGQFGASSASAFGASTGSGLFGTGSAPSFGGGGLFGSTPAGGGGMFGASGASQSSAPSFGAGGFGAKPATSFGSAPASTGGLFGTTSSPSFGLGTFGAGGGSAPSGSQPAFGTPGGTPLFQGGQGGFAVKSTPQYGSPYGSLPTIPSSGGYPDSTSKPAMVSSARVTSSLLSPRTIAPVSMMKLRPRGLSAFSRTRSPGSPAAAFFDVGTRESPVPPKLESPLLRARENPRKLFIRAPPEEAAAALLAATKSPKERSSLSRSVQDGATEEEATALEKTGSKAAANGENHCLTNGREEEAARTVPPAARDAPTLASPVRPGKTRATPLLPQLRAVDYFTKPDKAALEAMAQRDPDALARVENFTVGRRGVGTVRWLAPVDVRGLDLDALVKFQPREIRVYLDEEDKPPVGEGLNQPAEVTLFGIYRLDKATGKPMTDEKTVRKMREKLSRVVLEQTDGHGQMIDYDVHGGVWRFQVEHFSRYGLDEEDEDDEDWDAGLQQGEGVSDMNVPNDSAARAEGLEEDNGPLAGGKVFGLQDWEKEETQTSSEEKSSWEDEDLIWEDERLTRAAPPEKAFTPCPFGPATEEVQEMRKASLWDKHEASSPLHQTAVRPVHHAWRQANASPVQWNQATSVVAPATVTNPPRGGCAVLRTSMDSRLDQTCSTLFTKDTTRSRDLGLFLGASYRVGWGPGSVFVTACASPGASAASLKLHRVHPIGAEYKGEMDRGALIQQEEDRLKIHASYSSTASTSPSNGWTMPYQVFCCNDKSLHNVCQRYRLLLATSAQANEKGESLVWDLMAVLYGSLALSHENLFDDGSSPRRMEGVEQASHDEDDLVQCHRQHRDKDSFSDVDGAMEIGTQEWTEAISEDEEKWRRCAALSHWLRRASSAPVAHPTPSSPCFAVFQRLARRDVACAVGLAIEQGDVHLATLLAQAGARSRLAADLPYQLELWEDHGNLAYFDTERLRVYRLLAGHVQESLNGIQVSWRTCLGLHLWYAQGPAEPPSKAWKKYLEAVLHGNAPPPCPLHQEHSNFDMAVESIVEAMDYHLLQLHVSNEAGLPMHRDAVYLLRPSSVSPYPLDYVAPWHVGTVLASLGALDRHGLHRDLFTTITRRYLAQVQRMDVSVVWQVYVATHIPDRYVREAVLEEILIRTAGQWCENGEVQKQLEERLHVPAWYLHHALAVLYRSRCDEYMELEALLQALKTADAAAASADMQDSGDHEWGPKHEHAVEAEARLSAVIRRAHTLLHTSVAPLLLCNDELVKLRQLVDALVPFASRIGGWWQGGGLYLAHLTLLEGHPCLEEDAHVEALAGSWSSHSPHTDHSHVLRRAFSAMATALAESFSQRTAGLEVLRNEGGDLDGTTWAAQLQLHALAVELPALPELERMGAVHEAVDAYATWLATACVM